MKSTKNYNNRGYVKIRKGNHKPYNATKKKSTNRTNKNNWAMAEYMLSE